MKIFVHVTASAIKAFLNDNKLFAPQLTYEECIRNILRYGSTSMLGVNPDFFPENFFVAFSNSEFLQHKWARENAIEIQGNWETAILAAQMEAFEPDVFYTVNAQWFSNHHKQLPTVKCSAFWRAAPIQAEINYELFDVALTYAERYRKILHEVGMDNVELQPFSFDYRINEHLDNKKEKNDLAFIGTYNQQFKKRNNYLKSIVKHHFLTKTIRFHLKSSFRYRGTVPNINPWLLPVYRQPVYLRKMLLVFKASKIIFNCHSDMARKAKGNMRVYEALGTKSFMLTDEGDYPEHLTSGRDFITYKNKEDLSNKIIYYLNNPSQRKQIAEQGYESLKKYYHVKTGAERLMNIFSKYL